MNKILHPIETFLKTHPLVIVLISFILGTITASHKWLSDEPSFPILIIVMLLLIIGIMRMWQYNFVIIYAIFFFLGVLLSNQAIAPHNPQNHIRNIVEQTNITSAGTNVEGVLYDAPERFPDKTRLYVDAEKVFINDKIIPATGKILITVGSSSTQNLRYGDRVRFIARLKIPRNFGNPGEFDYAASLAMKDIYVTGYMENERWIAALADGQRPNIVSAIEKIRDRIRDFIEGSGVKNAAVMKGLILGESWEISQNIRDDFSATGTAHIIAISGLHIAIIAVSVYWLFFQLFRLSERLMLAFNIRKLAVLSSIIPILLYGAIAGYPVSTLRAVIMAMIFIIAVLMDRETGIYNTLAAAGFAILVVSPLAVYDISFQLSFISVLSIVYLAPKFQSVWKYREETAVAKLLPPHPAWKQLKDYFLNPLAVSIAASIGTAPVIAYHFHRLSLIGILANLIAVPVMGFLSVILGLISCVILFFNHALASIILKLTDITLNISLWIIDLFANIPYASIYATAPTMLEVVVFYLLIICLIELRRARMFKYALPILIVTLAGNYISWYYRLNYNPNLKVTFISVGQGDSALVEFPYGKRMLIDGGGSREEDFDVGERIIAPLLWKKKIDRIDYIILSHPQEDHMKGLKFIAERFGVKEFIWNGEDSKDLSYKELMHIIDKNNIRKLPANASTPALDINGVSILFLNPPEGSRLGINNNSLVAKLVYKDTNILFVGDIEDIGETAMLESGENIEATVLKVPHHGSMTSSGIDFLKKVHPKLAVVSVGYHNPFGFPHPEILKRYEELKIPVLRTDISGAVTVETDGVDIRILTFR